MALRAREDFACHRHRAELAESRLSCRNARPGARLPDRSAYGSGHRICTLVYIATGPPARIGVRWTMHILVVDDQGYFRIHIAGWLRMLDGVASVQAVASALEALTAVDEMKPDVVITDLRMPEMDGFELTRKIKSK